MKHCAIFVVLSFFVCQVLCVCDPAKGNETINPECLDPAAPYCRNDGKGYTCVQCRTLCDCELNEYCSNAPTTFGQCVEFTLVGEYCKPLSGEQLRQVAIPKAWKCAETSANDTNTVNVLHAGACIEETCRMCDPRVGGVICGAESGLKEARICGYPGHYVSEHSYNWNPGNYYEEPKNVWFAIFFCLIVIVLVTQVGIILFSARS